MYISWQVLNKIYKDSKPTTDGGRMYASSAPSGAFHVKWHKISEKSPIVDRFHVTHESSSKKVYYGLVNNSFIYLGSRPDDGEINWKTAESKVRPTPLDDFDGIAKSFLSNLFTYNPKDMRVSFKDAVLDDNAIDQKGEDQKERSKIIGELRSTYEKYTAEQFQKAGLTKTGVSQRYEWTPDQYKETFSKIDKANNLTPLVTETVSTTASSAVVVGTKIPLPIPTGHTLNVGPVTTITPTSSTGKYVPPSRRDNWKK